MKISHIISSLASTAAITAALIVTHTSNHVGPANLYPDPKLTPGKVATQSFEVLIAKNRDGQTYSQQNRNTTESQKRQVCAEYPENCKAGIHEIDHFCPLALGCADDVANLWAQPEHAIWNDVDYGYHTKDKLETFLVIQMKAGKISPKAAQDCILSDWVSCYGKYFSGFSADPSVPQDPDGEVAYP